MQPVNVTSLMSADYSELLSESHTLVVSQTFFGYKPFLCIEVHKRFLPALVEKKSHVKNISCNITYMFTVNSGNTSDMYLELESIFFQQTFFIYTAQSIG